jgi:hypothetical protein
MSNVGIPIKLLFEAEGMKVTVEVGAINHLLLCVKLSRWMSAVMADKDASTAYSA